MANKKAKAANGNKVDFLMHCRSVLFQVLGSEKMANIISSEVAVMYYAFFSGKEKSIDYKTKFTSYKENGLLLIFGVIPNSVVRVSRNTFVLYLFYEYTNKKILH